MKKRFTIHKLAILVPAVGVAGLVTNVWASGFQIWEQDGGSVGNYHAGRAAITEDASTSFYNPAGLVRIHNQQMVLAADPVLTNYVYKGTVSNDQLGGAPMAITDQGGRFNLVPSFNYAAPITDTIVFGFSVVTPFGFNTDYGNDTYMRYTSTLTSLQVVDYAPSLGYALNNQWSFGGGLDIEHASTDADFVTTTGSTANDTNGSAQGWSTTLGFHLGALYQLSEQTRVGVSYFSKVKHHLRGHSSFIGPMANNLTGGDQYSGNYYSAITLPATSTLSAFHTINQQIDIMASVIYTQWSVFKDVVMENVAGYDAGVMDNSMTVVVPENYKNTWNVSVGGNIHLDESFFVRMGLGYDQSPTNNDDSNAELPNSNRIAVALGGHFQANKALGFDLGWTHYFSVNPSIDVSQTVGDQTTNSNGSVNTNTDVYGVQLKWDIT